MISSALSPATGARPTPIDDAARELNSLKRVPAPRPWRWIASAVLIVLLAQFVHGLATNPGWDWPVFREFFTERTILKALGLTLQLTAYGTTLGFALGLVVALLRLSGSPLLNAVGWAYVWVFRAIPLIVQLLFWFNLAYLYDRLSFGVPFGPSFVSVPTMNLVSPMGAAVLGLALHQAAYAAEIIRAGVISVDRGQLDAAEAFGIPRRRQLRRIILPQAMRSILPNASNELITLFKGTSVVSVMALGDLFYQAQVIYGRNGRVIALVMVATVWYVILTGLLSILQYHVERYFARGSARPLPPTPWQRLRVALTAGRRPDDAPAPDAPARPDTGGATPHTTGGAR
ncbi:amino acid ABC transporter permease [Micromonospora cathayae]|uniref:Amino acid ABC transporter permease n=1 Tax=Micromonospora cathayae TaxID=3028804 RepID=A0ABY7ZU07_9ACTN|nr:amino acid ABC transporter permease [Micromonospora sp. HUAS 3]WDZ86541.1 amino acid ABC transporter permease [Micromonospora sp. HUAS 3]